MSDSIHSAAALLEGCILAGYLVISLFFLRFWMRAKDRLFLNFAGAFLLLAINRLMATLLQVPDDTRHFLYLVRLVAFLLIIWGIVDKNRAGAKRSSQPDPPSR